MALQNQKIYKGYSSFEFQSNKVFQLTDMDIVKMDLLNHIFTRTGERVMLADFGTAIPDLLFEPLDEITIETLREELTAVVNYDPRVSLIDLVTTPDFDAQSITAALDLFYIEFQIKDLMNLNLQFNQ